MIFWAQTFYICPWDAPTTNSGIARRVTSFGTTLVSKKWKLMILQDTTTTATILHISGWPVRLLRVFLKRIFVPGTHRQRIWKEHVELRRLTLLWCPKSENWWLLKVKTTTTATTTTYFWITGLTSPRFFEKSIRPWDTPTTDSERARRVTSFGTTLVSKKWKLMMVHASKNQPDKNRRFRRY